MKTPARKTENAWDQQMELETVPECKFANSTYYHTQKVGNPAKQNQLSNSCLTDPSHMFKDGIIAPLPIPHEYAFHMFLLQSPSNDFKVISRY